ncbi:shikimate kinase [Hathewaya proteolytica DSM 3090]|uniref:Shikimate kinase n=1 Tax=Hathewaya proteolytica DSM 3090 TaxID=1121331 RepID=A0A1M6QBQ0_9CLOT|nr:shikimate kinase [Hathewaya proteolytica]SHK17586.1 shikimate kinase [Hathewaya proteolytica DSM 3090]
MKKGFNIVLIGMPGCGKSTIGEIISYKLKMNLLDLDRYIEKFQGNTIAEIFKMGEEYFRNIESKCAAEVSKKKNTVICTGGGIVKKQENIENLKENGVIVFINRPLENIIADVDTSSRPLLKDNKDNLYSLYDERHDLYKKYCDIEVENLKDISSVVNTIIKKINEA